MNVFIDTSGLYAIFDRDDTHHQRAHHTWTKLLHEAATLVTNNYVLLEAGALLQNHFGISALRLLHEDVVPLLAVDWISEEQHQSAVQAVLTAARKKVSLVDCVSFQTMRDHGVRAAFCFDSHFREQGFQTIP